MEWMLMPLRRYADFSGRSRRMEFWMWQLFKFLLGWAIVILIMVLFGAAVTSVGAGGGSEALAAAGGAIILLYLFCMILGLAIFIPDLAVTVRRLHDTDRSGWWILAPLPPYVVFLGIALQNFDVTQPDRQPEGVAAVVMFAAIAVMALLGLALLVFYFLDGTPGPNKYGPDPKGRG